MSVVEQSCGDHAKISIAVRLAEQHIQTKKKHPDHKSPEIKHQLHLKGNCHTGLMSLVDFVRYLLRIAQYAIKQFFIEASHLQGKLALGSAKYMRPPQLGHI